jgi:hypothetical protein
MARQDTMTAAGAAQRLAQRLGGLGRARLAALAAVAVGVVVIVTLSLVGTDGGRPAARSARPREELQPRHAGPSGPAGLPQLGGRPARHRKLLRLLVRAVPEGDTAARQFFPRQAWQGGGHRHRRQRPDICRARVRPQTGVTYPVATEPATGSTVIAYDLPGLPATFFLDARHRIVKRVYGAVSQAELTSGAALIHERAR